MVEFFKNPAMLVSLFTAFAACLALFQTSRQIKLSNKHLLFEKRLKSYLMLNDLLENYAKYRREIEIGFDEKISEDQFSNQLKLKFFLLTNNVYLASISKVISEEDNNILQSEFIEKINDMQILEKELSFVFADVDTTCLEEFIKSYYELLIGIFQYKRFSASIKRKVILKSIKNSCTELDKLYKCIRETNTEIKMRKSIKL